MQDKLLTKFPAGIQEANAHIAGLKGCTIAAAHPQGKEEFCGITIKGVAYDERKRPPVSVWFSLVPNCPTPKKKSSAVTGALNCHCGSMLSKTEYQALLKGQRKYTVPLGTDPLGNIIRLDNSLNNFSERITAAENELTTLHQQQAAAEVKLRWKNPSHRRKNWQRNLHSLQS